MSIIEIRKGLRRLDFTARQDARMSELGTHVVVEFEVPTEFERDQLVLINLGLRNGVARELMGRPELVSTSGKKSSSYTYRLEGDVA